MKNAQLRKVIIFGTMLLAGLFVVQIYWFKKAFDVAEKQFDHSVQIALKKVADSVAADAEIKKLSSNFFIATTESSLNEKAIDTLVRNEFLLRSLNIDYELGVYYADDDTIVYGNYVEASKKISLDSKAMAIGAAGRQKNFAVYFPKKTSYLAA